MTGSEMTRRCFFLFRFLSFLSSDNWAGMTFLSFCDAVTNGGRISDESAWPCWACRLVLLAPSCSRIFNFFFFGFDSCALSSCCSWSSWWFSSSSRFRFLSILLDFFLGSSGTSSSASSLLRFFFFFFSDSVAGGSSWEVFWLLEVASFSCSNMKILKIWFKFLN